MDNVQTSVTAEIHMKSRTRVDWDKEIIDRTIEIATDPDAWAYLHRGNAYVYKGEYDKAIADFTKAIEYCPSFAEPYAWAYHERGSAYDLKGEEIKAITDLNKAIEYGSGYFHRGYFYSRKGEYDKAIADFTRAIDTSPRNALYYQMRAKAYRNKGEINRAEADFIRAKELGWQ
jgi:tetratricopeptide (TPR) repeat protein